VWKQNAQRIVEEGLYLKFSQNKDDIAGFLISLEGVEIVEASSRDRIWGIGFGASRALTVPKDQWGSNWLGQALMRVRDRLVDE
jgi:ribA/ribD-fused uncharacterized protein